MSFPISPGKLALLMASGRSRLAALVHAFSDASPAAELADDSEMSSAADFCDVRKSRQGDAEAYRRLIERHQAHVARIVWRFTRNRTAHEELVQDVFVEAYLSLAGYKQRAPFENWLSRIAIRVGYRYWKQTAGRAASHSWSVQEWDQLPNNEQSTVCEPSEAADLLYRLLQQLPPRDRLVLTLRYLDDCDVAETARRTGWTKIMVKVQTLRARTRLRKLFDRSKESIE
jgi:RNA polymerase sigma-70 factor (ECF subfamily)